MEKFDVDINEKTEETPKQKESKKVGMLKPHRGHTIYKYNKATSELTPVTFEDPKAKHKKLQVEKDCIYLSALNFKNAMRKVARYYGVNLKISKKDEKVQSK